MASWLIVRDELPTPCSLTDGHDLFRKTVALFVPRPTDAASVRRERRSVAMPALTGAISLIRRVGHVCASATVGSKLRQKKAKRSFFIAVTEGENIDVI